MCRVDVLQRVIALCKNHGFVVGPCKHTVSNGSRHFIGYGPLGAEMRRNLREEWWRDVVLSRGNVCGFEDQYWPLSDGKEDENTQFGLLDTHGLTSALTEPISRQNANESTRQTLESELQSILARRTIFPRQKNPDQCLESFFKMLKTVPGATVPFGFAQISNIIRKPGVDPMSRSPGEQEVMALQFLCDEGKSGQWLNHWRRQRLIWWRKFAHNPSNFSLVDEPDGKVTIQYDFPWGEHQHTEVEGIVHSQHVPCLSSDNTQYPLDKMPVRLIQAEACLDRGFLVYLLDAYEEKERADSQGIVATQKVLSLHPRVAPLKVAVLPRKSEMSELSQQLATELRGAGINALHMSGSSLDKCYTYQDEIGTPYCVTILESTLTNGVVALRSRNTTLQEFIHISEVVNTMKHHLGL